MSLVFYHIKLAIGYLKKYKPKNEAEKAQIDKLLELLEAAMELQ